MSLVLLLVMGAYLHLAGYNRGLEFTGYGAWDDVRIYLDAYYQTHDLEEKITLPGYPPGILAIDLAAHTLLHTQYEEAGRSYTVPGIHLVRFWAALANLLTAFLLAHIGKYLHSPAAGFLAALIFLVMPAIIQQSVMALSEAFQMAALMLCLLCAVLALKQDSPCLALLSCVAALLMIALKYSAYPVLVLPVGVILWSAWHGERKRWLLVLSAQCLMIGLVGVWLLLVYDAPRMIGMGAEADQFVRTNFLALIGDMRWFNMVTQAAGQLGLTPLLMLGIAAGGGIFYWRGAVPWQRLIYVGLSALYVAWCILVLAYLHFGELAYRYLLPAAPIGVLLLSLALVSLARALMQKNRAIGLSTFAIVLCLWLLPQTAQSFRRAYEFSLPDTYTAYIEWAQQKLPRDGILIAPWQQRMYFTENDMMELKDVAHDVIPESLLKRSRAELLNMGALYAYLEAPELAQLQQMPEKADDLATLLLLKQFPAPDDTSAWRGAKIYVYRLMPIEYPAEIVFSDQVRWMGYDLNATTFKPGETLTFIPYWQAITLPTANYTVFVRLMSGETIITQTEGQPARVPYPTSEWHDPHEIIVGQNFSLRLPDDLPVGEYSLIMGLHDAHTREILPTSSGDDFAVVTTTTIQR